MNNRYYLSLAPCTWIAAPGVRAFVFLVVATMVSFLMPIASELRASVTGQGDITPSKDGTDFEGNPITLPDLPSAGGDLGDDLVVGGTGMRIGNTDFGSMTINNPLFTNPLEVDSATIGLEATGSGIVIVTGFTSELNVINGGDLIVGASGQGRLQIEGGGLVTTTVELDPNGMPVGNAGDLIVGQFFGSQGDISVNGFASGIFVGNLTIGQFGTAALDVTDRATVRSTSAALGSMKNSISVVTFSGLGTRWLNQGDVQIGTDIGTADDENGHGTLQIKSDAIVTIGIPGSTEFTEGLTDIRELGRIDLAEGRLLTYDLNNLGVIHGAGQLQATNSFINAEFGEIRNAAGRANLREYLYVADPSVTLQNNGLIISEGGEMEFEGPVANNFTGDIIARDAIMRFNDGLDNDGELGLGGDTTIYAALSGGGDFLVLADSTTLLVGSLTLAPSSAVTLAVGDAPGTLDILGTADLNNSLLFLNYSGGVHGQSGDSYDILSASGGLGGSTFANPGDQVFADGRFWNIDYPGGNSVRVTAGEDPNCPPMGADFNGDCIVDGLDLAIWSMNYGLEGPVGFLDTLGDADGDGDVDGSDFLIIQIDLGGPPSLMAAVAAVPEPSALMLALSALAFGYRRRVA